MGTLLALVAQPVRALLSLVAHWVRRRFPGTAAVLTWVFSVVTSGIGLVLVIPSRFVMLVAYLVCAAMQLALSPLQWPAALWWMARHAVYWVSYGSLMLGIWLRRLAQGLACLLLHPAAPLVARVIVLFGWYSCTWLFVLAWWSFLSWLLLSARPRSGRWPLVLTSPALTSLV